MEGRTHQNEPHASIYVIPCLTQENQTPFPSLQNNEPVVSSNKLPIQLSGT